MEKKIREWIGDRATYNAHGQIIFREKGEGDEVVQNMFLDVRGWGNISNVFSSQKEAMAFQDAVGEWVADAINQKLTQQPKPEQEKGEISVKEWYAKETNRTVEELDEYDLYICEVVCKYAALSSPAKMPGVEEAKIDAILHALDTFLGDTDPGFSEEFTDDDIRQEEPILWAHMKLLEIKDSLFQKARMTEITEGGK